MTKFFVYGTLVTGSHYHPHYLQGKTFLGKGQVEDYAKYILGGLHGIIPEKGSQVKGEVYELDTAAQGKLDFLHNLGTMFSRGVVEVQLENGQTVTAETYIWNKTVSHGTGDAPSVSVNE